MNTTTPLRPPDRTRLTSLEPVDQSIVVLSDAELAERLREAARLLTAEPLRQERPALRRETFQYD